MRIDVFTIFPHAISEMAELSVLGRAQGQQKLDVRAHDLRMNATDPHKTVDDKPFKGSEGKNTQLTLGKDLFLKGFDKQLIGVKKND